MSLKWPGCFPAGKVPCCDISSADKLLTEGHSNHGAGQGHCGAPANAVLDIITSCLYGMNLYLAEGCPEEAPDGLIIHWLALQNL